jgi:hypothetical protein
VNSSGQGDRKFVLVGVVKLQLSQVVETRVDRLENLFADLLCDMALVGVD